MATFEPYPDSIAERSGCKVGWKTYATLADAKKAAKIAKARAADMAQRGYDFGYCCPGSIEELEAGGGEQPERTVFEVCVP